MADVRKGHICSICRQLRGVKIGVCWNECDFRRSCFLGIFSVFHRVGLVDVFSLSFDVVRSCPGGFFDLLGFCGGVQTVEILVGGIGVWEHGVEHPVEACYHLGAVLLEAIHSKGGNGSGKAKYLRINPGWSMSYCLGGIVLRGHVHYFLCHTHYLGKCNVTRVGDQCPFPWITHRFLHNLHGFGIVESLAPFGYTIGLGQKSLAVQFPIPHLPLDGILGQHVVTESYRKPGKWKTAGNYVRETHLWGFGYLSQNAWATCSQLKLNVVLSSKYFTIFPNYLFEMLLMTFSWRTTTNFYII